MMELEVYSDDHLAYVTASHNEVARTVELTPSILVDFDEFNMVVGVEFLDLDARIPFDRLVTECHVESSVIEELRRIQPTINGFVASFHASEPQNAGSTVPSSQMVSA